MLLEMVIAVETFDDRMLEGPYVDGKTRQAALRLAVLHEGGSIAEQHVRAISKQSVAARAAADIRANRPDAAIVIPDGHLPERRVGRTLRHEVEHAGRIGRTVER